MSINSPSIGLGAFPFHSETLEAEYNANIECSQYFIKYLAASLKENAAHIFKTIYEAGSTRDLAWANYQHMKNLNIITHKLID